MSTSSDDQKTAKPVMSLDQIRREISALDSELLNLFSRRRELSLAVAVNKLGDFKPVRDQQREQQLLDSLIDKGRELNLAPHYVTRLFHTIIEDSVILQRQYLQQHNNPELLSQSQKKIAILGGEGAYSHLAASKYFGCGDNQLNGYDSFQKILNSVTEGVDDFGVIPIENTTSGGINEVYDLLLESELSVVGEVNQPIEHCLLAAKSTNLDKINQVLAHPEASRQCNRSLQKLTSAKVRLVTSTAEALKLAAEDKTGTLAAIGSEKAAKVFNLQVLASSIANLKKNATRFLVVARDAHIVSPQVNCKTSLILSTGQKPGSLAEVLLVFRDANLPLSKLESRPISGKPWEQMFYIDFEGNIDDPAVSQALEDVKEISHFMKLLGSYPCEQVKPTRVSPTDFYSKNSPN